MNYAATLDDLQYDFKKWVTPKVAIALSRIDFDAPAFGYLIQNSPNCFFNTVGDAEIFNSQPGITSVPTWHEAAMWLYDRHGINIAISGNDIPISLQQRFLLKIRSIQNA